MKFCWCKWIWNKSIFIVILFEICIFFIKLLKENLLIKWIFFLYFENDLKCFMFIYIFFIWCGNYEFVIIFEIVVNKIFSIRIGDLIYKWFI